MRRISSAKVIGKLPVPWPVARDQRHMASVWMQAQCHRQRGGTTLEDRDFGDLFICQIFWARIAGHGTINDGHSGEQLGPVFHQKTPLPLR